MNQQIMNELVDVYLAGLCTGIASTALKLGMTLDAGQTLAQESVAAAMRDPIVMEQFKTEICEIVNGVDTGPKTIRVHG